MPARSTRVLLCLGLFLLTPLRLSAQRDSAGQTAPTATIQSMDGRLVDQLPVDRVRSAILLLPGVDAAADGGISLRGGRSSDLATYLDGVRVSPGYRKSGFLFQSTTVPSPGQSLLETGTNSIAGLEVLTGPLRSSSGGGQAGIVRLTTLVPGNRFEARGSYETDRPFGSRHGPGLDRLQGIAGGRLLERLRVAASATLEGHESEESGPGAADVGRFIPAGVDTVVGIPTTIGDPFTDTTFVEVSSFAPLNGIRMPGTGSSSYQLLGKLDYALGTGSGLWLSGLASRDEIRYLDGTEISVPPAGHRGTSRVLTLGAYHGLSISGRPLTLNLALSLQQDRTVGGPLTTENEADTRDGYFLSGLEFLYDMESFPVNDELIRNIRNNTPGSRRSPLDLENTGQYSLVNRFRNSAYGLDGGPESGGPAGRLMLLKENRTVGTGSAAWQLHRSHTLRAGFELTRYSLAGYSHNLVSQAYHDAFLADPVQSAAYLEDEVRAGSLTVIAGARYDRFRSDAERSFVLDTVSSSPTFNTYSYFPTPNSYGYGGITFNGQPLVKFVSDEARSALSPRVQVAFAATDRTILRLGVARQSQMPDLSLVLSGINTDLRTSNTDQVYGGDLDLERTTMYELGLHQAISPALTLDASVYHRELDDQALPLLQSLADPSRLGAPVDIRQITSLGLGKVRGLDARLDLHTGVLTGILGYALQQTERGNQGGGVPLEDSRPHTLTGALALEVPRDWGQGIIGAILRNSAAYGAFRYSSGTPYTRCAAESGNEDILSGEVCATTFAGEFLGSRLPAFKQLDLRISKTLSLAGRELVAYLDGRNILNFENVLRVFAVTGQTGNPAEAALVYAQDSAGFAAVGFANGIYGVNGELDLRYGGAVASGCGNFMNAQFTPSAPDCVYLIRAEERFGDGDHIFTLAEQRRASSAAYAAVRDESTFLGPPRRVRLGIEVRF